jgi:hypothetical protein
MLGLGPFSSAESADEADRLPPDSLLYNKPEESGGITGATSYMGINQIGPYVLVVV